MTETQMIPFDQLQPSPLNPRKTFDEEELEQLAGAIERDGILQNLVARPHPEKPGSFEIIAGERRWRAARRLVEAGTWDATAGIPVNVHPCDDLELLKLATIENIQRADLHPLEEAEAYRALVERGVPTDVIARHVGRSRRHVQLRLQLVDNLAEEVKDAFRKGEVDLARCRVLAAMAPKDRQDAVLENIREGHWSYETADDLRGVLVEDGIPVSYAHFNRSLYDGPVVEDPDDPEFEYFTDVELFNKLQGEAVEATRATLAAQYAWVEVINGRRYAWNYEPCKDKKKAGCIIEVWPDGEVKVVTDLARKGQPAPAGDTTRARRDAAEADGAPGPEAFLPNLLGLVQARVEKTKALRKAVVDAGASPAMILVIMALMEIAESEVKIRYMWPQGDDNVEDPATAMALNPHRKLLGDFGSGRPRHPAKKVYQALREMPKAELQALFTAVVARALGTFPGYRAELGDSELIAMLAEDLGADVAGAWSVDEAYLKACNRRPLMELAVDLELIGGELTRDQAGKMRVADLRQHVLEYLERTPDKKAVIPRAFKFGTKKQLEALAAQAAAETKPATKPKKKTKR